MQKNELLKLNLQLFNGAAGGAAAGGAASGGEAGEGAAQASESALPKAETNRSRGSSRRGKAGAYDNVVFGKQEDASANEVDASSVAGSEKGEGNANKSGVSTTSDTLEAKRKAFEDMIDGEYKDIYTEKFQQAFNRRFKETKGLEESLTAQKPIMDMLMQRYTIGDMGKLQQALEEDKSYWEGAAEEAGMTVEQYQAMQKLERENAELKRIREKQEGEQKVQQQVAAWVKDGEQVKAMYPSFNLQAELQNKEFVGLLKANVPMMQAYKLMHMDEIEAATAKQAAQTASAQMQANLKAKAARPSENGTSHQSAVIVKNDVSNLSRADRMEIARRVQRGEKITF